MTCWSRDCVTDYLTLMKNDLQTSPQGRLHNGDREYLQLCGAWVDHFLDLPDMAKEILDTVALLRCLDPPHGGGRYECLGYPSSLSLDGGFYLPPLRSIRQLSIKSCARSAGFDCKYFPSHEYDGRRRPRNNGMTTISFNFNEAATINLPSAVR